MDMSNGSNGRNRYIGQKLIFTRQTRFGDSVHWIHSNGFTVHSLDSLDMSIEHHWTTLPMDIMCNGDPLDKTIGPDLQLL